MIAHHDDTQGNETQLSPLERPRVFVKEINFNDGTTVHLNEDSIVVFTGANNSGKSQVLKDIEFLMNSSNQAKTKTIRKINLEFAGAIEETSFLTEQFTLGNEGYYQHVDSGMGFGLDYLHNIWNGRSLTNGLHKSFVRLLNTELRLTGANALHRSNISPSSPMMRLYNSQAMADKLSSLFRQAFGTDLALDRLDLQTVPLRVGEAPDPTAHTYAVHDIYKQKLESLPSLQEQGDGMRSFASIMLDAFTSSYSITLIDEPEAFLHPPQAKLLGKMLVKNSPQTRQLFISTHSQDFLQGLLDADSNNVTVIRINREHNVNYMNALNGSQIRELWDKPLLRYSNILSGLFHDKVVVCESDYDCLFYQAVLDSIYDSVNDVAPDVLFVQCGGKHRMKEVVAALVAVKVPVVAICDFDLIDSKQNFRGLVEAFGVDWGACLEDAMDVIYRSINGRAMTWSQMKKIGKAGFINAEPAAYEKVEAVCRAHGLFIVPAGEMECFDKTVGKDKKEWVYFVLENYDLAMEPRLEEARKFVRSVVEFSGNKRQ